MTFLVQLLALTLDQDPNNLQIGRTGTAVVQPGQVYDLVNNRPAQLSDVAAAAKGKPFMFLGENHATRAHQQMEADVVSELLRAGRKPVVGVEFFQRPVQDVLDQWSAGALTEDKFLQDADWKKQWGYSYEFYRPLFEVVKQNKLPLVGLNVPRKWVSSVGRGGPSGLPWYAKSQLPELRLDNKTHRQVFDAMVGGHPMGAGGPSADNMYAGQVLWDEAMADTAIKYRAAFPPKSEDVFVVVAGSGHVMYGQGINYRLARRKAGDGITVVMVQSDEPVTVARGIADFVYVTKPEPKKA